MANPFERKSWLSQSTTEPGALHDQPIPFGVHRCFHPHIHLRPPWSGKLSSACGLSMDLQQATATEENGTEHDSSLHVQLRRPCS